MSSGIRAKSLVVLAVLLIAFYFAAFHGIEYSNHRKGPWEMSFTVDGEGNPSLVIYEPKLNISSVEILFPGEKEPRTNFVQRVAFDQPQRPIPFGKIIYEDLTALPGVITLEVFGHFIEVFPRALMVDRKEYPWKSESTLELSITNKPGPPRLPPQKRE
jgi:hypothetical protein